VVVEKGGTTVVKSWWTLLRAEWDRIAGVALLVGGGVALVLGYRGVADSPFVSAQLPYVISGGFGGLLLCGLGIAVLVMADLHDEWRKLDRIESAIAGHRIERPLETPDEPPPAPEARRVALDRRRATLGAGLALGLALLGAGWARAAGTARSGVAYQGMAIGSSAIVVAVAAMTVVLAGRRAELARRRSVLLGGWLTSVGPLPGPGSGAAEETAGQVFIASTSRRFHRWSCPSLSGVEATPVRRDAVPPGLEPCGICGAS